MSAKGKKYPVKKQSPPVPINTYRVNQTDGGSCSEITGNQLKKDINCKVELKKV
jgi:hypothetical protein